LMVVSDQLYDTVIDQIFGHRAVQCLRKIIHHAATVHISVDLVSLDVLAVRDLQGINEARTCTESLSLFKHDVILRQ
jgi:hypothetical protein